MALLVSKTGGSSSILGCPALERVVKMVWRPVATRKIPGSIPGPLSKWS